jgi:hypothetical protein
MQRQQRLQRGNLAWLIALWEKKQFIVTIVRDDSAMTLTATNSSSVLIILP